MFTERFLFRVSQADLEAIDRIAEAKKVNKSAAIRMAVRAVAAVVSGEACENAPTAELGGGES